jgi:hypothetical protein
MQPLLRVEQRAGAEYRPMVNCVPERHAGVVVPLLVGLVVMGVMLVVMVSHVVGVEVPVVVLS